MSGSVESNPASGSAAVTPHASNPVPTHAKLGQSKALHIGGAGDITGRLVNDSSDTVFAGLSAGQTLPYSFSYIRATGTTATSIVALYNN